MPLSLDAGIERHADTSPGAVGSGRPHLVLAAVLGTFLVIAAGPLTPAAANDPDPRHPNAVRLTGDAVLTMCRSWVVFRTCKTYGRVRLPEHVALGQRLPLQFGSNNKYYSLPVVRIVKEGDQCIVTGEPGEPTDKIDHLIAPCTE